MEKTAILPGMFGGMDSDEVDEAQMCYAVVTEHATHRRMVVSGAAWPEGAIDEQVREILTRFEHALSEHGGSVDDVTMMRWYVLDDHLDRETQTRLHEVRGEFFERPHYPASTMVGVSSLLGDGLVEVDLEAEIPRDGWDVTTVERGDVEDE